MARIAKYLVYDCEEDTLIGTVDVRYYSDWKKRDAAAENKAAKLVRQKRKGQIIFNYVIQQIY